MSEDNGFVFDQLMTGVRRQSNLARTHDHYYGTYDINGVTYIGMPNYAGAAGTYIMAVNQTTGEVNIDGYMQVSNTLVHSVHNTTDGDFQATRIFPGLEASATGFSLFVTAAAAEARIQWAGDTATSPRLSYSRSGATLSYTNNSVTFISLQGAAFHGADSIKIGAVPINFYNDANYQMDITSTKPRITFDHVGGSADYIEYDRSNNRLDMYVGATRIRNQVSLPLHTAIVGAGVTVGAIDAHGAVIGSVWHIDVTDGSNTSIYLSGVKAPSDYVPGLVSLKLLCSSDAASNNVYIYPFLETLTPGVTGQIQDPAPGYAAFACPGTANQPFEVSVTSAGSPVANSSWVASILIDRSDVADTNTGVLSIWAAWVDYAAKLG